jgi:hypothetical protein
MRRASGLRPAVAVFAEELGCDIVIANPPPDFDMEMFRAIVATDTDCDGLRSLARETGRELGLRLATLLDPAMERIGLSFAPICSARPPSTRWRGSW